MNIPTSAAPRSSPGSARRKAPWTYQPAAPPRPSQGSGTPLPPNYCTASPKSPRRSATNTVPWKSPRTSPPPITSRSRNVPTELMQNLLCQVLPPLDEYSILFFCALIRRSSLPQVTSCGITSINKFYNSISSGRRSLTNMLGIEHLVRFSKIYNSFYECDYAGNICPAKQNT